MGEKGKTLHLLLYILNQCGVRFLLYHQVDAIKIKTLREPKINVFLSLFIYNTKGNASMLVLKALEFSSFSIRIFRAEKCSRISITKYKQIITVRSSYAGVR